MSNLQAAISEWKEQQPDLITDCLIGCECTVRACHARQLRWRYKKWGSDEEAHKPLFDACQGCRHLLTEDELKKKRRKRYRIAPGKTQRTWAWKFPRKRDVA